ncbi:hypothetical protein X740_08300 [Mesorhizobium sp. LNHC221B00]|nr:hypothetical protein X740_08300 [Mesorhizobium sp. LNHC221B00]
MLAGVKPLGTGKVACLAGSEFICVTGVKNHRGGIDGDHALQHMATADAATMFAGLAMIGHADLLNASSGV